MKIILIIYIIYFIIFSTVIFNFNKDVDKEKQKEFNNKDFYGEKSDDQVIIFDNPFRSALARLYIIENAQETPKLQVS